MKALLLAAIAAVAIACGGSAAVTPNPGHVTRAQFGAAWPLTIDSGDLRCEGGAIVFRAPDGTDYGVNGLAATFKDIGPIWAADPTGNSPKISLSPLIQAGQKLCP